LALKFAFRKLKKENEQKINATEFKELISDLLATEDGDADQNEHLMTFVPDLFNHLDADKDEHLNERELCSLAMYGSITGLHNMLRTAIFYAMDKDNDGLIDLKEMADILVKVVPPEDIKNYDLDTFVHLSMDEHADFRTPEGRPTKISIDVLVEHVTLLAKSVEEKDPNDKYKLLFRLLDINKDETITAKELQQYFNYQEMGMTRVVLDEMLLGIYNKEDKKLSYKEFCAILDNPKPVQYFCGTE